MDDILPEVPPDALAFAYRPYVTASAAAVNGKAPYTLHQSLLRDIKPPAAKLVDDSDSSCSASRSSSSDGSSCDRPAAPLNARIISRQIDAESDRHRMASMHAKSMYARIKEAKRLIDDCRYEYACDVLYECQRGFNFLGKANFSTKLLHLKDPPPWCDTSMKLTLPNVHSFQLPDPSWEWVSPRWLIDMTLDVDEDGWQYATKFSSASWHGRHSAAKSFVRRRRWLRLRRRYTPQPVCAGDRDADAKDDRVGEECYNEYMEVSENRRRKRANIVAAASKIKNTVSGNYVGTKPNSTTKASAKNLVAYTLKDGRYRSHNLKRTAKAAAASGAEAMPQPVSMPPSPVRRSPPKPNDEMSLAEEQQQNEEEEDSPGKHITGGLQLNPPQHQPHTHSAVDLLQNQLAESLQTQGSSASGTQNRNDEKNHSHHRAHHRHSHTRNNSAHSGRSATSQSPLPLPTGGTAHASSGMSQSYPVSLVPSTSLDAATTTSSAAASHGGYVDGVPESFPRLRALTAPGRTVPEMPKYSKSAECSYSNDDNTVMSSARPSLVHFPQLPSNLQLQRQHLSAANLLRYNISRSKSTGGIDGSQAMPGSQSNASHLAGTAYPIRPLPSFFRRRTTMTASSRPPAMDDDPDSTVVDSHLALPLGSSAQPKGDSRAVVPKGSAMSAHTTISRTSTGTSTSKSADNASFDILTIANTGNDNSGSASESRAGGALRGRSSLDSISSFFSDDLPELAPYVDPYRTLDLPGRQLFSSNSHNSDLSSGASNVLLAAAPPVAVSTAPVADRELLRMTSDSLKAMLRDILLDRERLEFIHEALVLGGLTAATIWYCLPWLHFELLQYDDARQRLIAMLLAFSHTCPLDVIRYFDLSVREGDRVCGLTNAHDISEESILGRMAAEDRSEYEAVVNSLDHYHDNRGDLETFSPSQAWRFVIRPVAACDYDLFYSDFKVMVMGVARWSLCRPVK
ncbi:hypothetical protein H4R99_003538 [Coemansia sp. RSA 1722]|nr:hypothetical protein H4R99_003538 [Coemansia sp. RSA 1722]